MKKKLEAFLEITTKGLPIGLIVLDDEEKIVYHKRTCGFTLNHKTLAGKLDYDQMKRVDKRIPSLVKKLLSTKKVSSTITFDPKSKLKRETRKRQWKKGERWINVCPEKKEVKWKTKKKLRN